jgi:hypothetical protein
VKPKQPLQPLIPLDELKKVVAQIVNAPKEKVERAKAKTSKPKT